MSDMRNKSVTLLACLLATSSVFAETTIFVNVNVVPMDTEVVLAQQSVVVVDGSIAKIGHVDTVPVPKGSLVIDGTDRYLMPGIAEMHAHVTSANARNVDRLSTLFVANGITTIRGMLGQNSHLKLRDQFESGAMFGPRLYTSGPSLNGRSVSGAADAARQVREQKAAGYDFIKVHPGLVVGQLHRRKNGLPYTHMRALLVNIRKFVIETSMVDGWGMTPSHSFRREG